MGSRNAFAYLASPAVVAASAISGKIDFPDHLDSSPTLGNIIERKKPVSEEVDVKILSDFPDILEGELIFCYQDNLNTDGIYPGKYTYIDEFTPEQQAGVVMENYDPKFKSLARSGDVLVGGFNFGTGSSREQAATALKYFGIRLVLAGSFSETYKRNALNNGFLTLEAPDLIKDLKEKFGDKSLTVRTGLKAQINFKKSRVEVDNKKYEIGPVGVAAQELVIFGGLENWVKKQLD
jgi:homoaconitate hydratase